MDYLQESLWESKEITHNYTGITRNHTGINRNHLNHVKLLESYRESQNPKESYVELYQAESMDDSESCQQKPQVLDPPDNTQWYVYKYGFCFVAMGFKALALCC